MSTGDRRVRKTKDALRTALDELLLERHYNRISVQDILDRADVGKTTFYAHYGNKDDLLTGNCFTTQIGKAFFNDQGDLRDFPDLQRLLNHFIARRDARLAAPGGPGWGVVRDTAHRDLHGHWLQWASQQPNLKVPPEAAAHFLAGGVFALIERWPEGSEDSLSEIVRSLLVDEVSKTNVGES